MEKKIVFLTVFFLFFIQGSKINADSQENVQLINYNQSKIIDMITLTPWINYNNTKEFQSKDVFLDFISAFEKFSQSNISASYRDFSKIIHNSSKDDFLYFNLAYEFAQMGLFSLAQNSLVQIEDLNLWTEQIKSLKQVYFPSVSLSFEEEIYLAEIYSNIMYSNMAMESVEELSRNHKILKKLDYANYLLALAYYKNKNYSRSLNYINKAIAFDNSNVNYLGFKAQILSDEAKYKDSIDIISIIDQKNIVLMNYIPKLELLRDYNLAKSARNKYEAKFLTANYYFKNGDTQRAIKELNSQYRNIDKETDVLSFPLGENGEYDTNLDTGAKLLGDIVISVEKAIEQADTYNHSLQREIGFLTVHSMLHLLGYDHMTPEEASVMEKKQAAALDALGITR